MKKAIAATVVALAAQATTAHAFCGFYVSGSGDKMFNDATQVVLVRDGTRTVLSMQNDYAGPLSDFAMVVPVPVVLHEPDVKTLPKSVFEHVESLGSPRLVEYWEQDPCFIPPPPAPMSVATKGAVYDSIGGADYKKDDGVKIEAKFDVAEYKILILSAKDSSGLERWLQQNHYQIPPDAEPLLRPYVEGGSKFFVAKVDPKKVQLVNGHAALSPLRFFYDSDEFALPIRLGMANSAGTQDLIVNIISRDKRFEVANYPNVFAPTNFDVRPAVKSRFGEFYAALFDRTIATHPGAVVTEYAWTASRGYHCDPCPDLDVSTQDIMTLGGDVVGGGLENNFVLTRLHARYGKGTLTDDLRFRVADAVTGGREQYSSNNQLEHGATKSAENFFQARYAIRHPWTGAVKCQNPRRGIWGGPPDGNNQVIAASKLAFAPRGKIALGDVVLRDLPEIKVWRGQSTAPTPAPAPANGSHFAQPPAKTQGFGVGALVTLALIGLGSLLVRKKT
jgi:hypothetical protein